jgi:hypothetical protein
MTRKLTLIALTGLFLNSCIMGYRRYPHPERTTPDKISGTLYYDVQGLSVFGGLSALGDYLKNESPFDSTELREETPSHGLYVRAKVRTVSPSVSSAVFGYLSLSTLTIFPMWSTKDGYTVIFDVYKDGQQVKSFDYETRRTTFTWLLALPFIWVNLFTTSEEKAFRLIGKQFFQDAAELLQP